MSENQVKITYKPLWKLLIDRDMTKTELRKKTQIAPSTFTKMNNDQQVSLDILARICVELKCGFDDIVVTLLYRLQKVNDSKEFRAESNKLLRAHKTELTLEAGVLLEKKKKNITEHTRPYEITYAVLCTKKNNTR